MNQNAPCKLCGKTSKLLRKSHIIPSFMYKGIQDESNRMAFAELHNINSSPKLQQTGFYDKYVLCSKCDNERIGGWEKYVASLLNGEDSKTVHSFKNAISPDGIKSIFIQNIDFRKFKLCLLSILWRAHISQNPFFKNVDLRGNEIEIQQMLLNDDPKDENTYKISVVAIKGTDGLFRMVVQPTVSQIENGLVAILFINGLFYFIDLFPSSGFKIFEKHYLKQNGDYEIMLLDGEQGKSFMKAFGLPSYIVDNFFE